MQEYGDLSTTLKAIATIFPTLTGDVTALRGEIAKTDEVKKLPVLYSLYQGQYAAAIVSNMQNLPIDLTGTWDCNFCRRRRCACGS